MTKNEFISIVENNNDIEFKIGNDNYTILTWTNMGITIAKANTEATTDYIVKIREIAKGKKDYSEAFNATREYLAAEKGALKWLLEAKIKFDDHIVINKQFNFNINIVKVF